MATDVRLLPPGTVIFEDISIEQFEGTVTKVIPKVPSKNQVYMQSLLLTLYIIERFTVDLWSGDIYPAFWSLFCVIF